MVKTFLTNLQTVRFLWPIHSQRSWFVVVLASLCYHFVVENANSVVELVSHLSLLFRKVEALDFG